MVTNNELDQIEQRIDCVAQALEGCRADAQAAFAFLCIELARRSTSGSDGTAAAGAGGLTPLDYRAQGREEALAIILAEDPENPFADQTNSVFGGEDYSTEWDEAALRELLHIGDRKHDAYDRAEAAYWDALGHKEEAEREMLFVRQAPFYEPLHDFLSKHRAYDLMGDLKRAAATSGSELAGDLPQHAGMIDFVDEFGRLSHKPGYTADQMRAYARTAIAQQDAPEAPTDERAQLLAELQAQEDDHAAIMRERVRAHLTATHQAGAAVDCGTYECRAGQRDGVICADGECDIASGQRAAPAPAAEEVRDSELLDWLNEQPVHFIELDDFSIIDVKGNDVRTAIRAAMSASQGKTEEAK